MTETVTLTIKLRGARRVTEELDDAMGRLSRLAGMSARKMRALADAARVPRPFDWRRDAFDDYVRSFPPVVGRGRGVQLGIAMVMLRIWPDDVPGPGDPVRRDGR